MSAKSSGNSKRLIEFDYTLKNSKGEVLDTSKDAGGQPMTYIEGAGQIIPGLENRMMGLKAGDAKEIHVPAAEAYGVREEKLVIEVPLDQFPKNQKVTVGLEVEIEVAQDYYHSFTVTKVGTQTATLDGNHELAGEDLYFSVEVKNARPATAKEIADSAHEHEHEHGPNCKH